MTIQEQPILSDSALHISIWRGDFANYYTKYPRLYRALTENELYICEDREVLKICFYVKYDMQKQWIEARFYDDFITNLRLLYGRQEIELEIITGMDLPF